MRRTVILRQNDLGLVNEIELLAILPLTSDN